MALIDEVGTTKKRDRRGSYRGSNERAARLAANRRRKQIERYYTYASIAIISGGVGVWLGIVAANWRV